MAEPIVIERRFRGPPESANGGYTCGLIAAPIEAPAVEATLRLPPPLERPLTLVRVDGERTELRDGDALVAEARAVDGVAVELPEPVDVEAAREARRASPLHREHPFPGCFVCGPERSPGDGLRIVSGPVPGRETELVAAPWEVDDSLPSKDGVVRDEMVWAALDCPSGNSVQLIAESGTAVVLGRLTASLERPVEVGRTYVAAGWLCEREGRKLSSASTILDSDGEPVARARAVWIQLREQPTTQC